MSDDEDDLDAIIMRTTERSTVQTTVVDIIEKAEIDEDIVSWYAVRLSSFKSLDITTTKNMLEGYKYILCEEGDGVTTKYHQHIVWVFSGTTDELRAIIKKVYPDCSGNKCIYIQASRDKKQLMKYTLKEGHYYYKGFSKPVIDKYFKLSVAKTDLKKDVKDNEDNFVLGKITLEDFTDRYIEIKIKHNQALYTNHLEAYIRMVLMRARPDKRREYSRYLAEKVSTY